MARVVLPKVRMFIPCVALDLEPGTTSTIHSPLHTIRLPPDASEGLVLDEIWFYVVLTDGLGSFRLTVELYSEEGSVLRRSRPFPITFLVGSQLSVRELPILMNEVPLPGPGMYEFKLMANHAPVVDGGTTLLRVLGA